MAERDMMEEIFECQKALNKRIGVDTDTLGEEQQVHWLLNYSRALTQETAELVDSLPWKWWAKYQTYDRANVQVEIVDLLHFLVSLAQVAGLEVKNLHVIMQQRKENVGVCQRDALEFFNDMPHLHGVRPQEIPARGTL